MQHVTVEFQFDIPDEECPYEAAERLIEEWCASGEALSDYAAIRITDIPS